jgi:(R,R)-butanediol dehydrogenase/meso-butanediol dehydrogenase/diacetyl reductase
VERFSRSAFAWRPNPFTCWTADVRELTVRFPVLYTLEEYQIALESLAKGHVEPRAMITGVVLLDTLPAVFESLCKPSQQCKVTIDPGHRGYFRSRSGCR